MSALPAGWIELRNHLQLRDGERRHGLPVAAHFAPTAVGSGTLPLGFSYTNDAGYAKTGTVSIMYRANSDDTVGASVSPAPAVASVSAGIPVGVTVTFASSDGAPAGPLSVTGSLPTGWTISGSSNCATVSNGTVCQIDLSYLPTTATGPGSFQLNYAYTNNAGTSGKTGTATVSYTANP